MGSPRSVWSGFQSAASSSGKRREKRRSTARTVSPATNGSANTLVPGPSPPTSLGTQGGTPIGGGGRPPELGGAAAHNARVNTLVPEPSPPTCLVTQVVTSIVMSRALSDLDCPRSAREPIIY